MAGAANVSDTEQWFFFCPRTEREVHGGRPMRTTPSGYWKATGSPSGVVSSSADRVLGEKRTMVFYEGRAPRGTKTPWKMNEYKAAVVADPGPVAATPAPLKLRNEFSVCRVYKSNGTLRSFDRRPLNPAGHDKVAIHNQQQQLVLPSTMNIIKQLTADTIANRQRTEKSYDSSSSGSGGAAVDGTDDTAIDWESLIPLLRN
ncbi:hypothetical protein EJB05_29433, partial [Eragrostis curvula]